MSVSAQTIAELCFTQLWIAPIDPSHGLRKSFHFIKRTTRNQIKQDSLTEAAVQTSAWLFQRDGDVSATCHSSGTWGTSDHLKQKTSRLLVPLYDGTSPAGEVKMKKSDLPKGIKRAQSGGRPAWCRLGSSTQILPSHRGNAAPLPPHVWAHLRLYIAFTPTFCPHSALRRRRVCIPRSIWLNYLEECFTCCVYYIYGFIFCPSVKRKKEDLKSLGRTTDFAFLTRLKGDETPHLYTQTFIKHKRHFDNTCWQMAKASWDLFRVLLLLGATPVGYF